MIQQTGDFLWRNANGDVYLDLSNAGTGFSGVAGQDFGAIPTSWTIEQVGDFNDDGKADILWRNSNGDVYLYLSNPGSGFTGFTGQDLGVIPTSWSIQQVGDFNGDGKTDILWRNTNGDVVFWLSNAGAGYTGFTSHDNGVVGTDWKIVGDSPPTLGSVPGHQTVTSAAQAAPPPSLAKAGTAVSHRAGGADAWHALTFNIDDGGHLSNGLDTSLTVTDPFQANLHARPDHMLFG